MNQQQSIGDSEIKESSVQQTQAGQDAVIFQNSDQNSVVIEKTFLRLFSPSQSSAVDWDWAERLLRKKQLPEIRQRLQDTLRGRHLMNVSLTEQSKWVNRLQTERRLKVDGQADTILSPNKLLIESFGRDDIAGKLLILGAPGSGKTTVLLSLAEQLIIGALAKPKTVIPVLLELSTWQDDKQSIEQWMVEQLYELHGGNRKQKLYEIFLERQVLLPLLDGLDELGLERQKKCTEKLNEFAKIYPQVVICCRVKEFQTANVKLQNLRGAICLQPLLDQQIKEYFDLIQRPDIWQGIQTNPILRKLLEDNEDEVVGLLRLPLFVSLLADVYDPKVNIETKSDFLRQYVASQLSLNKRETDRRSELQGYRWSYSTVNKEPNHDQIVHYLSWLSFRLMVSSKVDFGIESIQPWWLGKEKFIDSYRIFLGIPIGVLFGTGLALIGESLTGFVGGIIGFLAGILIGILLAQKFLDHPIWFDGNSKIHLVSNMQLPRSKKDLSRLMLGLFCGVIIGLNNSLTFLGMQWCLINLINFYRYLNSSINSLDLSLPWDFFASRGWLWILFLMTWLTMGLTKGVILGLKQDLKIRYHPNQGIRNSIYYLTCFVFLFLFVFLTILCLINYFASPYYLDEQAKTLFIIFGSQTIIYACVSESTGFSLMQYFFLRLTLWQSSIMPWNIAQFLNYCVERRLLLRVGGTYRFLHWELLTYFIEMSLPDTADEFLEVLKTFVISIKDILGDRPFPDPDP